MEFYSENRGIEFHFKPEEPEYGSVTLRLPSKEVYDKFRATAVKKKARMVRGRQLEEEINERQLDRLLWDYQIVGWKNVRLDGVELECNSENKAKMMLQVPAFASFVNQMILYMNETMFEEEEEEEQD